MDDKDIKIQFINVKNDKVLLNNLNNMLPTIYIKESYYSNENIEYYLSMYLNTKISNIKNIKDNYFSFDLEKELSDYSYKDINTIEDTLLKDIVKRNV